MYQDKVNEIKKCAIAEIRGILRTRGYYDMAKKEYRLPINDGTEDVPQLFTDDEYGEFGRFTVWAILEIRGNLLIEFDTIKSVDNLFADDLATLADYCLNLTNEDFRIAREWQENEGVI